VGGLLLFADEEINTYWESYQQISHMLEDSDLADRLGP
jgi:hypothetical protein